mmetsp:Transcript_84178/g.219079  ORF Transcript_84178/g.219079 Transcript_84178/m.219079 type:complete len:286 (-) Transcript_84178:633-1490(-)
MWHVVSISSFSVFKLAKAATSSCRSLSAFAVVSSCSAKERFLRNSKLLLRAASRSALICWASSSWADSAAKRSPCNWRFFWRSSWMALFSVDRLASLWMPAPSSAASSPSSDVDTESLPNAKEHVDIPASLPLPVGRAPRKPPSSALRVALITDTWDSCKSSSSCRIFSCKVEFFSFSSKAAVDADRDSSLATANSFDMDFTCSFSDTICFSTEAFSSRSSSSLLLSSAISWACACVVTSRLPPLRNAALPPPPPPCACSSGTLASAICRCSSAASMSARASVSS